MKERIQSVISTAHEQSEAVYAAEMWRLRKDIVNFHGEMVLLENYSSINYTGMSVCCVRLYRDRQLLQVHGLMNLQDWQRY